MNDRGHKMEVPFRHRCACAKRTELEKTAISNNVKCFHFKTLHFSLSLN